MKKIYLSIIAMALISISFAQKSSTHDRVYMQRNCEITDQTNFKPTNPAVEKGITLWSNDCSNAADWTLTHTTGAGYHTVDWYVETSLVLPSSAFSDFASTTASNGYLMCNSDGNGTGDFDGTIIEAWAQIATPIDLTGYPNVVLEFQHNFRWWQDIRQVQVSGDNGANWTDFQISDASGNLSGAQEQNTGNPEVTRIDISSIAGGQSQVLVRFYYNDQDYWGWYWAVDDVSIKVKDDNDIVNISSYIFGENSGGIEYGRTPVDHVEANYVMGSEIFNFGVLDQTNVTSSGDFVSFSNTATASTIMADSTDFVESLEALTLSVGTYQGVFTVSSDGDTLNAPTFVDNTYERNFEITDSIYAIDGIGNHPAGYESLSSLGTNSFVDNNVTPPANISADAFVLGNLYHINQADEVARLRVLLSSGTVAGGEIFAIIVDTASFWSGDIYANALHYSSGTIVNSTDISNGYVDVWFDQAATLNPGVYYACVELNSNNTANDIRVVDDASVLQPFDASVIFIAGDGAYSNGNAFGIRMIMGSWGVGMDETTIEGIQVYPNPSEGVINITNDNNQLNTIEVYDVLGKIVFTKISNTIETLDLSAHGTGVYVVKVSNNYGSISERVIIK